MSIANTILDQIGGARFILMTGAKNLVNHGNALSFKLPAKFAKDGINYVKITLNGLDLYDVEYGKIKKFEYKLLSTSEGLYFDMLKEDFTAKTGLHTSL